MVVDFGLGSKQNSYFDSGKARFFATNGFLHKTRFRSREACLHQAAQLLQSAKPLVSGSFDSFAA